MLLIGPQTTYRRASVTGSCSACNGTKEVRLSHEWISCPSCTQTTHPIEPADVFGGVTLFDYIDPDIKMAEKHYNEEVERLRLRTEWAKNERLKAEEAEKEAIAARATIKRETDNAREVLRYARDEVRRAQANLERLEEKCGSIDTLHNVLGWVQDELRKRVHRGDEVTLCDAVRLISDHLGDEKLAWKKGLMSDMAKESPHKLDYELGRVDFSKFKVT